MRKSKYPEGTICAAQICTRLRRKRDWCDGHYSRWKSTGDVQDHLPLPPPKKSPICVVTECHTAEHARGLCASHYNQTIGVTPTSGDNTVTQLMETCSGNLCNDPRTSGPYCTYHADLDQRRLSGEFTIEDISRAMFPLDNGCWVHINRSNDYGYNSLRVGARIRGIHRVSYALSIGIDVDELDAGMVVMHSCDNPPCFNPDHLSLGSETDNMLDASEKLRLHVGEDNHYSKLRESDVLKIRAMSPDRSAKDLAQEFDIHVVTVYDILKRKTWKHLNDEQD